MMLSKRAMEIAQRHNHGAGRIARGELCEDICALAREFAAEAIRGMTWTGVPISSFSRLHVVMIAMPLAEGLFGLGFGSKAEAEAWREKAIEMAVDAAAGAR